jgi:hypothetical protein
VTTIETTKEQWCEAEVHRIAGEIALMSPEPDAMKAQAYFERALAVARAQQAKSWELRAAMSMARLWRDQGKRDCPSSDDLRSFDGFRKGGSGSSVIEIMRHAGGAASDDLRLSGA